MELSYFDVHSHISFSDFDDDITLVLKRMRDSGVGTIVIGTNLQSSQEAVRFAEKHDNIFATVGCHPCDGKGRSVDQGEYEKMIKSPKAVGVGECGLDYYRIDTSDVIEKNRQKGLFTQQVTFAQEHKKPLMIHGRPSRGTMDAYEDILAILENTDDSYGNVHFFVGSQEIANRFFALGFTISFTGVLTFTDDYDSVVKNSPLSKILSETDSPYATPSPHRGTRNEPSLVPLVVKKIAEIRGEKYETVRSAIFDNAVRLWKLPL